MSLSPKIDRIDETHQVHAALPAVVPGSEPVPPRLPQHVLIALPAEPVGLVLELSSSNFSLSLSTLQGLWKADLALVTVGIHVLPRLVLGQRDYDGLSSPRRAGAELGRHGQAGHQGQQEDDGRLGAERR